MSENRLNAYKLLEFLKLPIELIYDEFKRFVKYIECANKGKQNKGPRT